jgi:hypothetical protein
MHFSKVYASLLSSLPKELSDNAINYRQVCNLIIASCSDSHVTRKLKKVVNQLVHELEALGLGPTVLQSLQTNHLITFQQPLQGELEVESSTPRVVYELSDNFHSTIQPRLRILLPNEPVKEESTNFDGKCQPPGSLLWALTSQPTLSESTSLTSNHTGSEEKTMNTS